MRTALAKAVREEFASKILELFPTLKRTRNPELVKGDVTYRLEVDGKLSFYIMLLIGDNHDEFTVEIGWAEGQGHAKHFLISPEKSFERSGSRCRLCKLWTKKDDWWLLTPRKTAEEMVRDIKEGRFFDDPPIEEAMSKVVPQVADAVSKIEKYAVPFFERIAVKYGCSLKARKS